MKMKQLTRKGFTLVELLVVIAIIVALAALATPSILKSRKKADMVQAVNNQKEVYKVFLSFEEEYGALPDDVTAEEVQKDSDVQTGSATSNELLSQLIFSGEIESEEIFYAKGGASRNRKPDGLFGVNQPDETLQPGECGFAYIMVQGGGGDNSGERGQSFSDNPNRIILATPMEQDSNSFKPDPYDGKAVLLKLDGSAITEKISRQNAIVKSGAGEDIFAGGEQTIWGSTTPVIKKPE